MNQIVNEADLVSAIPLDKPLPRVMTRREKLLHWAALVRNCTVPISLMSGLEYFTEQMLQQPSFYVGCAQKYGASTPFGLAFDDPLFSAMGLIGQPHGQEIAGTINQVIDFFELTKDQLHQFSCNCGGDISKDEMARRIERLAGPAPQAPTVVDSASWTGRF